MTLPKRTPPADPNSFFQGGHCGCGENCDDLVVDLFDPLRCFHRLRILADPTTIQSFVRCLEQPDHPGEKKEGGKDASHSHDQKNHALEEILHRYRLRLTKE